ncbi:MAG: response regulator [Flavobacteriaceae bacterium]|nr:response regulator [Flavobacteriaceae bacterium]
MISKKICIVDDDDFYKLLLKKTIQNLKINTEVISFCNGEEAIKGLFALNSNIENLPDIILLDINMPVMDGWEFMEHYLALKHNFAKEMTLYIASSSIASQDIQKSKSFKEISGYLIKPIFKETIKNLLEEKVVL